MTRGSGCGAKSSVRMLISKLPGIKAQWPICGGKVLFAKTKGGGRVKLHHSQGLAKPSQDDSST